MTSEDREPFTPMPAYAGGSQPLPCSALRLCPLLLAEGPCTCQWLLGVAQHSLEVTEPTFFSPGREEFVTHTKQPRGIEVTWVLLYQSRKGKPAPPTSVWSHLLASFPLEVSTTPHWGFLPWQPHSHNLQSCPSHKELWTFSVQGRPVFFL